MALAINKPHWLLISISRSVRPSKAFLPLTFAIALRTHHAYTDRGIRKILAVYSKEAGMKHSISPHKLRHFLFTWLKKQGIEDALIQPFSGHESRKSLEVYSKLSIGDAQESYENAISKFPV